jgi:hypothetical protein
MTINYMCTLRENKLLTIGNYFLSQIKAPFGHQMWELNLSPNWINECLVKSMKN